MNLFNLAGAPNLSPPFTPLSMSATAKVRQMNPVCYVDICNIIQHSVVYLVVCASPCSCCGVQTASGTLIRRISIIILAGHDFS